MNYSAVVVASGSGSRTGLKYNKVFYKLSEMTVIEKSISNFVEDNDCKEIIIVINNKEISDFKELNLPPKVKFVDGGARRQDSVYNGLMEVQEEYVMIHDGARPYLRMDSIEAIKKALHEYDAALLMVESIDTGKIVKDGVVFKTLKRSEVYNAQTPQAFKTSLIKDCYNKLNEQGLETTDDAQVVELMSDEKIKVVIGDYSNIKITTKEDLK